MVLCCSTLGWASRRKRQFCIGVRKSLYEGLTWTPSDIGITTSFVVVEAFIVHCFHRKCGFNLREYLVASEEELDRELQWASNRSDSKRFIPEDPYKDDTLKFERSLNRSERERLEEHSEAPDIGLLVVDLGQNADRGTTSDTGVLMTSIRNVGLLWCYAAGRFLTSSEMLCAMGFPSTTRLAVVAGGHCMFTPVFLLTMAAHGGLPDSNAAMPCTSIALGLSLRVSSR